MSDIVEKFDITGFGFGYEDLAKLELELELDDGTIVLHNEKSEINTQPLLEDIEEAEDEELSEVFQRPFGVEGIRGNSRERSSSEFAIELEEEEEKEPAVECVTEEQVVEQKEPEIRRINKLKLKIDGNELEEELPFDIEEDPEILDYLTKNLQKTMSISKKSDKKFKK